MYIPIDHMAHQAPLTQIEIIHRLKNVGFTQEQAETQAQIVTEVHDNALATKQDIKDLRFWCEGEFLAAKQDIKDLRFWCEGEFKDVRNEIALVKKEFTVLRAET